MNALKPKTAEVYFIYECPTCGASHQLTREETVFPGRILCYCKAKLDIEPITKVKVQPIYSVDIGFGLTMPKDTGEVIEKSAEGFDYEEVVSALVKLGFSRREAKHQIVETVDREVDVSTTEKLLQKIILNNTMRR